MVFITIKISVLFIIAFLLNFHIVLAQDKNLPFKLIEGYGGKQLGKINAMSQDPKGYMWFASPGDKCIYRYDGNKIVSYNHDDTNPNSPGGIYPQSIIAASDGIIWIGYEDRGVDRFDPSTGIFKHFRHDDKDSGSLSANKVPVIFKDHRGRIWAGTENGLDLLNEQTGKFTHYRHDNQKPGSISSNSVRCIYEDHSGVLWIGTGFPFFNQHPEDGGLNRLDANGQFTSYKNDPNNPHSLISNKVSAIFEDSRGVFWVGTGGDGLHTMDRKTGVFERHLYDPSKPEGLSRPPFQKDEYHHTNEQITFIIEDVVGAIWIGSMWSGINRYDTGTKKITRYDSSYGFPVHSSWSASTSRDGVLWITTEDDKLFRVYPLPKPARAVYENTPVSGIFEDGERTLWVSTVGKGLLQYDANKKLINHYKVNDSLTQPGQDRTSCIYSNGGDTIWVAGMTNMKIFNKRSGKLSDFSLGYQFSRDDIASVFDVLEDGRGNVWFSSMHGIFQYSQRYDTIKRYHSDRKDSGSLSIDITTRILPDSTDEVWFGTWGGGVNRLNPKTGIFRHYLSDRQVIDLYRDHNGILWAGTSDGLYTYDRNKEAFSPFFDAHSGLTHEVVFRIIEDDSANLWLSTSIGVVELNAARDKKFIFDKKYGIVDLTFGAVAKTKAGELLFGSENGFYCFYPNELSRYKDLKINITALTVNNKQVLTGNESVLKTPVENMTDLDLSYNQNNLGFSFAAVDYRSPETTKYSTRLDGYDNEWREALGEKSIIYFNISPGNYIFRIRAANQDGVVNEKLVNILIHPPWWKTWWSYMAYAILLILSVWGYIRWRTKSLETDKIMLEEKVTNRTRELKNEKELVERTLSELKITQTQLIQSEKMASMGELTAGIAHEIQNPLNFVNNFSEINSELLGELKHALEAGNTKEAGDIANNLEDNEQKIVFHGRRADSIVKAMLLHSRSSTGQKEPTDINKLADEYLRLAYHGLRAKDKTFNTTMKTDFDPKIEKINVIPQDIGRVLLNLYNNAFYAVAERAKDQSDNYEPTVEVSTKKSGNKIEISVKDNGNGIPKNTLNKIFQPFFTTKPTGEGTGLGLSLSFDIITKSHGGELKVDTKEGKYTVFTICLPAD
jgi:signal transduction histidine kinase/ligand-binding sensor domain-containing protein